MESSRDVPESRAGDGSYLPIGRLLLAPATRAGESTLNVVVVAPIALGFGSVTLDLQFSF